MYNAENDKIYRGPWDTGREETMEEFLGNWYVNGKPAVTIWKGKLVCWPESSMNTIIEKMMCKGDEFDLGAGFDIHKFIHDDIEYVTYVAYGDQNICDVVTKEEWNKRVRSMLVE